MLIWAIVAYLCPFLMMVGFAIAQGVMGALFTPPPHPTPEMLQAVVRIYKEGSWAAITAQRTSEALHRNWAFTQSIIENEPECVKILGPGGELNFMNRAGLAMIDAEGPEQVLGQKVQDLVVPEHREAFIKLNERVFAGESGTLEFEMAGFKGSRRWLETHAVPLRDAGVYKTRSHLSRGFTGPGLI